MKEGFDIKIWRNYYDQVQSLADKLKESSEIGEEGVHEKKMREQIARLLKLSVKYLNEYGIKPNRPLWNYVRNDETTHASSLKFKYPYLLKSEIIKEEVNA